MERDKEAAGRYRRRAEKVRTIANDMGDKGLRSILTGVAEDYEKMARDQDNAVSTDAQTRKPKR